MGYSKYHFPGHDHDADERAPCRAAGTGLLGKSAAMHALKRVGLPGEVAMTAVFLASEEAAFVTGEDIEVDGGLCTLPRFEE